MKCRVDNLSDEELYELSLEKRKNKNGTAKAYAAQLEIQRRGMPIVSHRYRNGSSKRYAYNEDYMEAETDNR